MPARPWHFMCWACFCERKGEMAEREAELERARERGAREGWQRGYLAGRQRGYAEGFRNGASAKENKPGRPDEPGPLRAAVSLTHPDRHPPERHGTANAVTALLLAALKNGNKEEAK